LVKINIVYCIAKDYELNIEARHFKGVSLMFLGRLRKFLRIWYLNIIALKSPKLRKQIHLVCNNCSPITRWEVALIATIWVTFLTWQPNERCIDADHISTKFLHYVSHFINHKAKHFLFLCERYDVWCPIEINVLKTYFS